MDTFAERFKAYFDRDVAQRAAKSIGDGAEIEFQILGAEGKTEETFTFTKNGGRNQVLPRTAASPQLLFLVPTAAAEEILADKSDDVGGIGVGIMKLVVAADQKRKVVVKFKAGFLTLFSKGYFGVMTAGGSAFGSFLASHGLNGMGAIKAALKKLKD